MKETAKMLIVLTLIAGVCGLLLSVVRSATEDKIEDVLLHNVKGPALKKALAGSQNDLIKDRKSIIIDKKKLTIFIGKKEGQPWAYAFEVKGKGFGGDIGVLVGFNLQKDELTGIGITTLKETPGVGMRVVEDTFTSNFKEKPLSANFHIRKENGVIDAVTGATISSRGVCSAVRKAVSLAPKIRSQLGLQ